MNRAIHRVERRIRIAGVFLLAGLAIEALSLTRVAALSFVASSALGISVLMIGAVVFLLALPDASVDENRTPR